MRSMPKLNKVRNEHGSTLLISLIMLMLLTMIAISAISASSNSIQVVGNAQFRIQAEAAAQRAIENVISNDTFKFTAPAAQNIDVNSDGVADFSVAFTPAPRCVSWNRAKGTDPGIPKTCIGELGVCYWMVWDITAEVTDLSGTGAAGTIHQGIKNIADYDVARAECGV